LSAETAPAATAVPVKQVVVSRAAPFLVKAAAQAPDPY